MADDDFNKQLDLEPSEWSREGKPESAWGSGAPVLAVQLVGAVFIWWLLGRMMDSYGRWPGIGITALILSPLLVIEKLLALSGPIRRLLRRK